MSYLEMLEDELLDMRRDLAGSFAMISIQQRQIRIAELYYAREKREVALDSLVNFCINGKFEDE